MAVSPASGHGDSVARILEKRILVTVFSACMLGGCQLASYPLTAAIAGAGTSSAIGHTMNGAAFRTFTAPVDEVKMAVLDTLSNMGIRVDSFETTEHGERVTGSAIRRTVRVELEPISSKATRIEVVTKNGGIFYDNATATEIVLQTEKALGVSAGMNSSAGSGRAPRCCY
jgi:hypothetical protein